MSTTDTKRGPGRPAEGPGGESRDHRLWVRVSASEQGAWRARAAELGIEVSELVRRAMAAYRPSR